MFQITSLFFSLCLYYFAMQIKTYFKINSIIFYFFHGFWIFFHTKKRQLHAIYGCVFVHVCLTLRISSWFFYGLIFTFYSMNYIYVIYFSVEGEVGCHLYFYILIYILNDYIVIIHFMYGSVTSHFSTLSKISWVFFLSSFPCEY